MERKMKIHTNIENGIEVEYIIDDLGGVHSEGLGWNPAGEFCGECSKTDCSECNVYRQKYKKI